MGVKKRNATAMKNKKKIDNRNGNDLANTSVLTKYTSTLWVY